jgi:hypothetical protein
VLAPAWQVTGVLFTALILSSILFHYQTVFATQTENIWLYPKLLFFSVVIFYSLDHIYDELKFGRTLAKRKTSLALNGLLSVFAFLFLIWHVFRFFDQVSFATVLLPASFTLAYFLLVLGLRIPLRGAKEIIIAMVVAAALFYPQASDSGWIKNIPLIFPVFLVCLQNLVVFGFFEKDKDDHFGFSTVFSEMDVRQAHRYTLVFLWILTAVLVMFFLVFDSVIFSTFYCSLAYLGMATFPKAFQKFRLYRFVADGVLLFLLL